MDQFYYQWKDGIGLPHGAYNHELSAADFMHHFNPQAMMLPQPAVHPPLTTMGKPPDSSAYNLGVRGPHSDEEDSRGVVFEDEYSHHVQTAAPPEPKSKRKRKKKKKDPNAPKKPLTAYFFYMQTMRPKIMQEEPTLKMKEISGRLGGEWKLMSTSACGHFLYSSRGLEQRAPYQQRADADRARFAEEMRTYVAPDLDDSDEEGDGKKKKRRKRDPDAPKKPLTAYFHFMNAERPKYREENPKAPHKVLSKLLGAQWATMTDDDKSPFVEQAAQDKRRYEAEMEEYKAMQNRQSEDHQLDEHSSHHQTNHHEAVVDDASFPSVVAASLPLTDAALWHDPLRHF